MLLFTFPVLYLGQSCFLLQISLPHCKPVLFRVEGVVGKCIRREKSEIAEISSEVKSVLMENGYVNQNPGEFEGLVVEKQVLADQQGDVYGADNQDGQQIQVHRNNELLASQETQGPSTPVKINEDHGAGNEVVVREKPILMVTNENRPRLRWTYELHDYFLQAVIKLGGPYSQCSSPNALGKFVDLYFAMIFSATLPFNASCRFPTVLLSIIDDFTEFLELPWDSAVGTDATAKAILDLMDLDGLNLCHVKSHLQKYRLGNLTLKDSQDTSKNASQRLGGPQSLRPMNPAPRTKQATEHNGRHRPRRARNSNVEGRGQLYRELQGRKRNRPNLEVQSHLNTTPAGHPFGGAATENAFPYGQPLAGLGTSTTMPGPSDFSEAAALPQFYVNQHNICRPTYVTPIGQANLGTQEVPLGYQPQPSHYPAPEGFSTPNGDPASSNQETLAVLPSTSSEVDMFQAEEDADHIQAILNWGNDEPINLRY
ncbi:hypothetical protein GQ457_04G025530 [Hibiscus cannabinus]